MTAEYAEAHADVPASQPSGGDFHAAFAMEDGTQDVAVVMGDVAGHGPQQTAQAEHMRELLSDCIAVGLSPGESLTAVNAVIEADPHFKVFGTVFAGVLEAETGKLTYSSGGHEPALLTPHPTDAVPVHELAASGPPVGAFPDGVAQFEDEIVTIPDGGTLLLYTDGIPDVKHPHSRTEWLGLERLKQMFVGLSALPPRKLVSALLRNVADFCRGRFHDDVSVMAIRRRVSRGGVKRKKP